MRSDSEGGPYETEHADAGTSSRLEQGETAWAEDAVEVERDMGNPNPAPAVRKIRDLALFNLAIDSKFRGCDLLSLKVNDISQGRSIMHRAIAMQRKTHRPVQFEITDMTRQSPLAWIDHAKLSNNGYLFPSRIAESPHLSTRQYGRIVRRWWSPSDSISRPMVPIRCGERKRR